MEIQKLYVTLYDVKHSGLKEIASQLNIDISHLTKPDKQSFVTIIDPKIRALDKVFYLVVGKKTIPTVYELGDDEIRARKRDQ